MRVRQFVLFVALGMFAVPTLAAECFDDMPGELGIRADTPGRPKVTELVINDRGERAFVATEYLGSENLQASIYLLRHGKYCLAGDLGAAVAVRSDRGMKGDSYFGVVVESKSGSDRFFRTFKYSGDSYALSRCRVRPSGGSLRECKESEPGSSVSARGLTGEQSVFDAECRIASTLGAVLTLKNAGREIVIPNRADVCGAGYTYYAEGANGRAGLLVLAPLELGLRALSSVYRVSFSTGESSLVGEMPTAAEHVAAGVFQNILQEGGSLFLERYRVDTTSVRRDDSSLELVVEGVVCTDAPKAIFVRSIDPAKPCRRRVVASKTKPVCVVHDPGTSRLGSPSTCKALQEQWSRGGDDPSLPTKLENSLDRQKP